MLVYQNFVKESLTAEGYLKDIKFNIPEDFNFGFDCVDAVAKKSPDKEAIVWLSEQSEEKRFTFADVARESARTANYYKSLGIKKGDRVLVVLKRHYHFWFTIVALHKIGAVSIPATFLLTKKDYVYRFNAAGIKAVIATDENDTPAHIEEALPESPSLEIKIINGAEREGWHNLNREYKAFSDNFPRPSGEEATKKTDRMLMYFTSGTSGYPKIVAHDFTYPLGHVITARYWHNVDPNGIHLTIADTGWGKAVWGKLYGQWLCETCVFVYDFMKFQAHDILTKIQDYKITTFCAPPTMFRFFIQEDMSKYDLSSLKYATIAGEALNPEVFYKFKEITGISLMEGFGQTETTLTLANLTGMTPKPGSMGKPTPQYDVVILDPNGNPVKTGAVGEICLRTDKGRPVGMFCEYYNDPAKTEEVWHDNLYHTGDTAWMDEDGYCWFVGRTDDLIKSSGYRIGPFEVESCLMEHPAVTEVAVTAVPDPIRGQAVKATIVLSKGYTASDELTKELQNYVKTHTAPYKYPRVVEFVDELPKTISGKIRRVQLREEDKQKAEQNK